MKTKTIQYALGAGLLLCSVAVSSAASSLVTFQVDMSVAATNATFDPNTQTVAVRGNFTGWGSALLALTNNPNGVNTNLWTGTTNIPLNGSVIAFKYVIETADTYEGSHNRLVTLPSNSGGSVTAPVAYFNDVPPEPFTNSVTFQIDMAQQINVGHFDALTGVVQARGGFNGWGPPGAIAATNDPTILRTNQFGLVTSNVFVYTYEITGSPGQSLDYKYHIDQADNWESPAPGTGDPNDNNNRFFTLGAGPTQTIPIVFFNDSPYAPLATNDVTFQVDMSAQVMSGQYDPSNPANTVQVRGDFNGWGTPVIACTNDPASPNTNLYKAVVTITDGVGARHSYKFWSSVSANGGWEVVNKDPGLNRSLQIVSGSAQTLPPVFFSDTPVGALMSTDTVVTISVDMTGAVGTDAHAFDPVNDTVWAAGFGFDYNLWRWQAPFSTADFQIQLTNNPVSSMIYTTEFTVTRGFPLGLTYKFAINQLNDEPGGNHVRYVYTPGAYAFPLDKFGVAVNGNPVPNLNATPSPGHVTLTWLGRPGVTVQNKGSLSSGPWLPHPETDGLSATNWPTGGSGSFFRLSMP